MMTKEERAHMLRMQFTLALTGAIESLELMQDFGLVNESERDAKAFLMTARQLTRRIYAEVQNAHDRQWGTRLCRAKALNEQEVK